MPCYCPALWLLLSWKMERDVQIFYFHVHIGTISCFCHQTQVSQQRTPKIFWVGFNLQVSNLVPLRLCDQINFYSTKSTVKIRWCGIDFTKCRISRYFQYKCQIRPSSTVRDCKLRLKLSHMRTELSWCWEIHFSRRGSDHLIPLC